MAAVVLGNVVGLAANAAASVHQMRASEAESSAVTYYIANNSKDANYQRDVVSRTETQRVGSITSVQSFCEVAVLLLIIAAFVVVGALCARILRSRLKPIGVDAGYDAFMATVGRTLRRQMLGTTGFIFVTFLLRSVYTIMNAVALQLRDYSKQCPGRATATSYCDATCHNVYSHVSFWISNTPEFPLMIMLISSPVAQLVALWGMTTKSTLQLMKSSKRGGYDLIRLLYGATTYLTSLARGGTGSTHALSENRMIDLIYYYVLMCKRHNTCYVRRCGRSTGAVVTSVGGTSCAAQRQ
jgi:hypothetical protein